MSGPGFTPPGLGWTVLVTLTAGPATARMVAESSRYSVGGIRVLLRSAEEAGLVQSRPGDGGDPALIWSLTPAGEAHVAAQSPGAVAR